MLPCGSDWAEHVAARTAFAPPSSSVRHRRFGSELPFQPCGVIHVLTAQRAEQRKTIMTTFTIDTDNHIMAHATPEDAATTTTTPFDSFSSPQEFVELAQSWPAKRLLAIWSSLPGVQPIRKFTGTPPRLAECAPNEVPLWAGPEVRLCSHTYNTPRSRNAWIAARLTGSSVTGRINSYPTVALRLAVNAISSLPAKGAMRSVGGRRNRTGSLSGQTSGPTDASGCVDCQCLLQPRAGPRLELRPISRRLAPRFRGRPGRRPRAGGRLYPRQVHPASAKPHLAALARHVGPRVPGQAGTGLAAGGRPILVYDGGPPQPDEWDLYQGPGVGSAAGQFRQPHASGQAAAQVGSAAEAYPESGANHAGAGAPAGSGVADQPDLPGDRSTHFGGHRIAHPARGSEAVLRADRATSLAGRHRRTQDGAEPADAGAGDATGALPAMDCGSGRAQSGGLGISATAGWERADVGLRGAQGTEAGGGGGGVRLCGPGAAHATAGQHHLAARGGG